MNEVVVIPPDVTQAATYVTSAWKQGVESIIETGRRLDEIRDKFKSERGKWSMLIGHNQYKGQGVLPFGKSYVFMLNKIAQSEWVVQHAGLMPSDATTMYHLTRLSDERRAVLLEDGRIHPGVKRNEASAETPARGRQVYGDDQASG